MNNQDIRNEAKEKGVFLYEVAHKLGVSEPTMVRWLRFELPADKKAKILKTISELSIEKANRKTA